MFDFISLSEFWLTPLRFMCGSSVLLGCAWIAERSGIIKQMRLRLWAWRLAIVGSCLLMLPMTVSITPSFRYEHPLQPEESIAARPEELLADGRYQAETIYLDSEPQAILSANSSEPLQPVANATNTTAASEYL